MPRWLILTGLVLVLVGFLLILIGSATSESGELEGGGVVFIGPIPIVFGSNSKMALVSAVIGGIILLAAALRYWN
ncbi:MAG: DUF131 domain-containing protein [Candidatus Nanohaloarchaea archaeon]|nr:DUF131 domain-containing protein [Candidatus Nanohaloarchaea archaeon]